jgi:hypothetical protein
MTPDSWNLDSLISNVGCEMVNAQCKMRNEEIWFSN